MGKRKRTDEEIERKIRRLQRKLEKRGESSESEHIPEQHEHVPTNNTPENEILIDLFGDNTEEENQTQTSVPPVITADQENTLDSKVLEILGDSPIDKDKQGPPIHNNIAERWMNVLLVGLDKEEKSKLLKEYPAPANCPLINPPQLNLEIKVAISESVCKKDKIHEIKQKQLGAALSCLGRAMDILIKGKDHQALKPVSDAARLLCDQQYFESLTRRHLILAVLNKTTKDAIQGVKPDEWLFGKDLTERIKACKAVNRSASDLKNRPYRPHYTNKFSQAPAITAPTSSLNWRGPSQLQQYRPQGQARGGLRQARPTLTQYRGRKFRRN